MKKIKILAVCLLVAMVFCLAFTGCDSEERENATISLDYDDILVKPVAASAQGATAIDSSKITLSNDLTDDIAVLESAAYLFTLANENAHKVDFSASVSEGRGYADVSTGGLTLRGNMEVREFNCNEGASKFYEGFGQVMSGQNMTSGEDIGSILAAIRAILDYAERTYSPDGTVFYKQRDMNVLKSTSISEFAPGTDQYLNWSEARKSKSHKYSATQWLDEGVGKVNKHYQDIDNANIQAQYISQAKISYNKEGYYCCYFEVIPTSDALKLGREGLRDSTGSKDLDYVYHHVTMEVWDCGLMRYYSTANSWEATILAFKGVSQNEYYRYFTYNKDNVTSLLNYDTSWTSMCK
ncbi:MAG: hypothetical protein ACI4MI_01395 [Christensenellales bacterium]